MEFEERILLICCFVLISQATLGATFTDFKSIFHTPNSKFDEYEILERSNFQSDNSQQNKQNKHGKGDSPQAVANAQVLLHMKEGDHHPHPHQPMHIYSSGPQYVNLNGGMRPQPTFYPIPPIPRVPPIPRAPPSPRAPPIPRVPSHPGSIPPHPAHIPSHHANNPSHPPRTPYTHPFSFYHEKPNYAHYHTGYETYLFPMHYFDPNYGHNPYYPNQDMGGPNYPYHTDKRPGRGRNYNINAGIGEDTFNIGVDSYPEDEDQYAGEIEPAPAEDIQTTVPPCDEPQTTLPSTEPCEDLQTTLPSTEPCEDLQTTPPTEPCDYTTLPPETPCEDDDENPSTVPPTTESSVDDNDANHQSTLPYTEEQTTEPTTEEQTTEPTTEEQTTVPTTEGQTTEPTTEGQTTVPTTEGQTTVPTTEGQTTEPTTEQQTTALTTEQQTTEITTEQQTTVPTTEEQSTEPTTDNHTTEPTTELTTEAQTTELTTENQTTEPTTELTTEAQTTEPTTENQTTEPTTELSTEVQTTEGTTESQTTEPTTDNQTTEPTTEAQTTESVTGEQTTEPTTEEITTVHTTEPTTEEQTTESTTEPITEPTTKEQTTESIVPCTTEQITQPTSQEQTTAPTIEEQTTAPTTEEQTMESTTEELTTGPTTEIQTTEPTTEKQTTEPITEEQTTEPITEEQTTELTTEEQTTSLNENNEDDNQNAEKTTPCSPQTTTPCGDDNEDSYETTTLYDWEEDDSCSHETTTLFDNEQDDNSDQEITTPCDVEDEDHSNYETTTPCEEEGDHGTTTPSAEEEEVCESFVPYEDDSTNTETTTPHDSESNDAVKPCPDDDLELPSDYWVDIDVPEEEIEEEFTIGSEEIPDLPLIEDSSEIQNPPLPVEDESAEETQCEDTTVLPPELPSVPEVPGEDEENLPTEPYEEICELSEEVSVNNPTESGTSDDDLPTEDWAPGELNNQLPSNQHHTSPHLVHNSYSFNRPHFTQPLKESKSDKPKRPNLRSESATKAPSLPSKVIRHSSKGYATINSLGPRRRIIQFKTSQKSKPLSISAKQPNLSSSKDNASQNLKTSSQDFRSNNKYSHNQYDDEYNLSPSAKKSGTSSPKETNNLSKSPTTQKPSKTSSLDTKNISSHKLEIPSKVSKHSAQGSKNVYKLNNPHHRAYHISQNKDKSQYLPVSNNEPKSSLTSQKYSQSTHLKPLTTTLNHNLEGKSCESQQCTSEYPPSSDASKLCDIHKSKHLCNILETPSTYPTPQPCNERDEGNTCTDNSSAQYGESQSCEQNFCGEELEFNSRKTIAPPPTTIATPCALTESESPLITTGSACTTQEITTTSRATAGDLDLLSLIMPGFALSELNVQKQSKDTPLDVETNYNTATASPVNSREEIKTTLDTPCETTTELNILELLTPKYDRRPLKSESHTVTSCFDPIKSITGYEGSMSSESSEFYSDVTTEATDDAQKRSTSKQVETTTIKTFTTEYLPETTTETTTTTASDPERFLTTPSNCDCAKPCDSAEELTRSPEFSLNDLFALLTTTNRPIDSKESISCDSSMEPLIETSESLDDLSISTESTYTTTTQSPEATDSLYDYSISTEMPFITRTNSPDCDDRSSTSAGCCNPENKVISKSVKKCCDPDCTTKKSYDPEEENSVETSAQDQENISENPQINPSDADQSLSKKLCDSDTDNVRFKADLERRAYETTTESPCETTTFTSQELEQLFASKGPCDIHDLDSKTPKAQPDSEHRSRLEGFGSKELIGSFGKSQPCETTTFNSQELEQLFTTNNPCDSQDLKPKPCQPNKVQSDVYRSNDLRGFASEELMGLFSKPEPCETTTFTSQELEQLFTTPINPCNIKDMDPKSCEPKPKPEVMPDGQESKNFKGSNELIRSIGKPELSETTTFTSQELEKLFTTNNPCDIQDLRSIPYEPNANTNVELDSEQTNKLKENSQSCETTTFTSKELEQLFTTNNPYDAQNLKPKPCEPNVKTKVERDAEQSNNNSEGHSQPCETTFSSKELEQLFTTNKPYGTQNLKPKSCESSVKSTTSKSNNLKEKSEPCESVTFSSKELEQLFTTNNLCDRNGTPKIEPESKKRQILEGFGSKERIGSFGKSQPCETAKLTSKEFTAKKTCDTQNLQSNPCEAITTPKVQLDSENPCSLEGFQSKELMDLFVKSQPCDSLEIKNNGLTKSQANFERTTFREPNARKCVRSQEVTCKSNHLKIKKPLQLNRKRQRVKKLSDNTPKISSKPCTENAPGVRNEETGYTHCDFQKPTRVCNDEKSIPTATQSKLTCSKSQEGDIPKGSINCKCPKTSRSNAQGLICDSQQPIQSCKLHKCNKKKSRQSKTPGRKDVMCSSNISVTNQQPISSAKKVCEAKHVICGLQKKLSSNSQECKPCGSQAATESSQKVVTLSERESVVCHSQDPMQTRETLKLAKSSVKNCNLKRSKHTCDTDKLPTEVTIPCNKDRVLGHPKQSFNTCKTQPTVPSKTACENKDKHKMCGKVETSSQKHMKPCERQQLVQTSACLLEKAIHTCDNKEPAQSSGTPCNNKRVIDDPKKSIDICKTQETVIPSACDEKPAMQKHCNPCDTTIESLAKVVTPCKKEYVPQKHIRTFETLQPTKNNLETPSHACNNDESVQNLITSPIPCKDKHIISDPEKPAISCETQQPAAKISTVCEEKHCNVIGNPEKYTQQQPTVSSQTALTKNQVSCNSQKRLECKDVQEQLNNYNSNKTADPSVKVLTNCKEEPIKSSETLPPALHSCNLRNGTHTCDDKQPGQCASIPCNTKPAIDVVKKSVETCETQQPTESSTTFCKEYHASCDCPKTIDSANLQEHGDACNSQIDEKPLDEVTTPCQEEIFEHNPSKTCITLQRVVSSCDYKKPIHTCDNKESEQSLATPCNGGQGINDSKKSTVTCKDQHPMDLSTAICKEKDVICDCRKIIKTVTSLHDKACNDQSNADPLDQVATPCKEERVEQKTTKTCKTLQPAFSTSSHNFQKPNNGCDIKEPVQSSVAVAPHCDEKRIIQNPCKTCDHQPSLTTPCKENLVVIDSKEAIQPSEYQQHINNCGKQAGDVSSVKVKTPCGKADVGPDSQKPNKSCNTCKALKPAQSSTRTCKNVDVECDIQRPMNTSPPPMQSSTRTCNLQIPIHTCDNKEHKHVPQDTKLCKEEQNKSIRTRKSQKHKISSTTSCETNHVQKLPPCDVEKTIHACDNRKCKPCENGHGNCAPKESIVTCKPQQPSTITCHLQKTASSCDNKKSDPKTSETHFQKGYNAQENVKPAECTTHSPKLCNQKLSKPSKDGDMKKCTNFQQKSCDGKIPSACDSSKQKHTKEFKTNEPKSINTDDKQRVCYSKVPNHKCDSENPLEKKVHGCDSEKPRTPIAKDAKMKISDSDNCNLPQLNKSCKTQVTGSTTSATKVCEICDTKGQKSKVCNLQKPKEKNESVLKSHTQEGNEGDKSCLSKTSSMLPRETTTDTVQQELDSHMIPRNIGKAHGDNNIVSPHFPHLVIEDHCTIPTSITVTSLNVPIDRDACTTLKSQSAVDLTQQPHSISQYKPFILPISSPTVHASPDYGYFLVDPYPIITAPSYQITSEPYQVTYEEPIEDYCFSSPIQMEIEINPPTTHNSNYCIIEEPSIIYPSTIEDIVSLTEPHASFHEPRITSPLEPFSTYASLVIVPYDSVTETNTHITEYYPKPAETPSYFQDHMDLSLIILPYESITEPRTKVTAYFPSMHHPTLETTSPKASTFLNRPQVYSPYYHQTLPHCNYDVWEKIDSTITEAHTLVPPTIIYSQPHEDCVPTEAKLNGLLRLLSFAKSSTTEPATTGNQCAISSRAGFGDLDEEDKSFQLETITDFQDSDESLSDCDFLTTTDLLKAIKSSPINTLADTQAQVRPIFELFKTYKPRESASSNIGHQLTESKTSNFKPPVTKSLRINQSSKLSSSPMHETRNPVPSITDSPFQAFHRSPSPPGSNQSKESERRSANIYPSSNNPLSDNGVLRNQQPSTGSFDSFERQSTFGSNGNYVLDTECEAPQDSVIQIQSNNQQIFAPHNHLIASKPGAVVQIQANAPVDHGQPGSVVQVQMNNVKPNHQPQVTKPTNSQPVKHGQPGSVVQVQLNNVKPKHQPQVTKPANNNPVKHGQPGSVIQVQLNNVKPNYKPQVTKPTNAWKAKPHEQMPNPQPGTPPACHKKQPCHLLPAEGNANIMNPFTNADVKPTNLINQCQKENCDGALDHENGSIHLISHHRYQPRKHGMIPKHPGNEPEPNSPLENQDEEPSSIDEIPEDARGSPPIDSLLDLDANVGVEVGGGPGTYSLLDGIIGPESNPPENSASSIGPITRPSLPKNLPVIRPSISNPPTRPTTGASSIGPFTRPNNPFIPRTIPANYVYQTQNNNPRPTYHFNNQEPVIQIQTNNGGRNRHSYPTPGSIVQINKHRPTLVFYTSPQEVRNPYTFMYPSGVTQIQQNQGGSGRVAQIQENYGPGTQIQQNFDYPRARQLSTNQEPIYIQTMHEGNQYGIEPIEIYAEEPSLPVLPVLAPAAVKPTGYTGMPADSHVVQASINLGLSKDGLAETVHSLTRPVFSAVEPLINDFVPAGYTRPKTTEYMEIKAPVSFYTPEKSNMSPNKSIPPPPKLCHACRSHLRKSKNHRAGYSSLCDNCKMNIFDYHKLLKTSSEEIDAAETKPTFPSDVDDLNKYNSQESWAKLEHLRQQLAESQDGGDDQNEALKVYEVLKQPQKPNYPQSLIYMNPSDLVDRNPNPQTQAFDPLIFYRPHSPRIHANGRTCPNCAPYRGELNYLSSNQN